MRYKHMKEEDIYETLRRWGAGHTISRIAETQDRDRKTVRFYIGQAKEAGLSKETLLSGREKLYNTISKMVPQNGRPDNAYRELEGLEEEFRSLVCDPKESVCPKTAFEIMKNLSWGRAGIWNLTFP